MTMTILVAGILVTLIFNKVVQCTLVTKPSDAAVKIGNYVIMRCSSSYVNDTCGQIGWKHFIPNSDSGDYNIIISDGQFSPSVKSYISLINSSAGNCDLEIKATPSAAGRYQCRDAEFDEANAELIVLENDPEVELVKKSYSEITALECSVKYYCNYRNWATEVRWMKNVGDSWTNVASNDSEKSESPVSCFIQIHSAKFDPTGTTEYFICNVTISKSGGSNMPIYTWQSQKIDTTWKIKIGCPISCDGCGIHVGFLAFFVIATCVLAGATIYLWCKNGVKNKTREK